MTTNEQPSHDGTPSKSDNVLQRFLDWLSTFPRGRSTHVTTSKSPRAKISPLGNGRDVSVWQSRIPTGDGQT